MTVQTGIFKEPMDAHVVGELNLAGDQQADLTVHDGSEQAVYAYPAEHYEYWRNELPRSRSRGASSARTLQLKDCLRTHCASAIVCGLGLPF